MSAKQKITFDTGDYNKWNSTNIIPIADGIQRKIIQHIEEYQSQKRKSPKEVVVRMGISIYHEARTGLPLRYKGEKEVLYLFDLYVEVICDWEIDRNTLEIEITSYGIKTT